MEPENILQEMNEVTSELIRAGISVDQNFPSIRITTDGKRVVGMPSDTDLSVTLRNIPYPEAYAVLRDSRSYSLRLIDGGLVQMLFTYGAGGLEKQRLAFFPSPDLLEYQNNSDVYEMDDLYAEVIAKNVVTTPLRFDFDPQNFVAGEHPRSHLTIGQYKNCRIPVSCALTPFLFMEFILMAFYNTPGRNIAANLVARAGRFATCIDPSEVPRVHIHACGGVAA